jgi:large subunit ribosomal protein L10Ae
LSSKITNALVLQCIQDMRAATKERKFVQTVELQVGLKDYDP